MAALTCLYKNELRDFVIQTSVDYLLNNLQSKYPDLFTEYKYQELLITKGGNQPPKSQFIFEYQPNYIRFLQIRDFSSENTPTFIPINSRNKICKKDDILIGRYGASIGKILTGKEGAYNVACAKMEVLQSEVLHKPFLFYLLHSSIIQNTLRGITRGAQAGFKREDLEKIPLSIPNISFQDKLTEILNSANNSIINNIPFEIKNYQNELLNDFQYLVKLKMVTAKKTESFQTEQQTQKHLIQQLRQAILQEAVQGKLLPQNPDDEPASELLKRIKAEKQALIAAKVIKREKYLPPIEAEDLPFELPKGWVWCRLGEVIENITAGKSPKCHSHPASKNEYGVIKMSAVSWGVFNQIENKTLPKEISPHLESRIYKGDFLMTRANTSVLIGNSVIVDNDYPYLLLNDKTLRVSFSKNIDKHYINFLNKGRILRKYFASVATGTSESMQNISRANIKFAPIPLPPLSEQKRIVEKVEKLLQYCEALEGEIENSVGNAEVLMQAVLQEAFG